jgi:predicted RNA-binding protein associated with RNAse of E/G family
MFKDIKNEINQLNNFIEEYEKTKDNSEKYAVLFSVIFSIFIFVYCCFTSNDILINVLTLAATAILSSVSLMGLYSAGIGILFNKKTKQKIEKNGISNIFNFKNIYKEKQLKKTVDIFLLLPNSSKEWIIKNANTLTKSYNYQDKVNVAESYKRYKLMKISKSKNMFEEMFFYINEIKQEDDSSNLIFILIDFYLENAAHECFLKNRDQLIKIIQKEIKSTKEQEKLADKIEVILNKIQEKSILEDRFEKFKDKTMNKESLLKMKNKNLVIKAI